MSASASRPGTVSTIGPAKGESRAELQRYIEVHERLKKLLETERRHTREAKAQHMRLMTNRTELEGMLRDCVDEMKEEAGISAKDADRDPTGHGLSKEDRERVLELLLSQEKAIAQLYGDAYRTSAPSVSILRILVVLRPGFSSAIISSYLSCRLTFCTSRLWHLYQQTLPQLTTTQCAGHNHAGKCTRG
jgi:hypothetical protein